MTKVKRSLRPSLFSFRLVRTNCNGINQQTKLGLRDISFSSSSVCRGYLAKKKYKEVLAEKNRAATKIQAHYRGHKERKSFKRKR